MAECHPVGFQWVMEAKARGAKLIHVDPRFTRTSAVADVHVPLRAGSDITFVGGLINYVLQEEKYFRDYVVSYTNAPTILTEDFADTEDLDGIFSGFDPEHRTYDFRYWRYQGRAAQPASGKRGRVADAEGGRLQQVRQAGRGEAHGSGGAAAHPSPDTDETLQHPRCVFQVLKRHFARYTPEMVEQICGVPQELFAKVVRAASRTTQAATAPRRSSTASAGRSTPSACSTSAPRRSCRRCSATWAARVAASSRCAGTRPSRARPTSPRCSTCCPAICRCRTRTATPISTPTPGRSPRTRDSGRTPRHYLVSLLKAWWGERRPLSTTSATTTCRG